MECVRCGLDIDCSLRDSYGHVLQSLRDRADEACLGPVAVTPAGKGRFVMCRIGIAFGSRIADEPNNGRGYGR
jgi:hypothetical protein